jgi:hypothetical protein
LRQQSFQNLGRCCICPYLGIRFLNTSRPKGPKLQGNARAVAARACGGVLVASSGCRACSSNGASATGRPMQDRLPVQDGLLIQLGFRERSHEILAAPRAESLYDESCLMVACFVGGKPLVVFFCPRCIMMRKRIIQLHM